MSEQMEKAVKRPYRKRRRAVQEQETRLLITEAAVDLHGTVGPARTTVSAIAERAGVQRATVYRHFPDEEALFGACSAHWLAANPPPDIEEWREIGDPGSRLQAALDELYSWYGNTESMLEKTTRDAPVVPAMRAPMEAMSRWREMGAEILLRGRASRGARRRLTRAAIVLALDFATWRSLVRQEGLDRGASVELMTALVASAERA